MLHPEIVVGASPISGRGLIAREDIPVGAVIWRADSRADAAHSIVTRAERDALCAAERERFHVHAWQIDADHWCHGSPDADLSLLMNHNCDPNAWFVTDTLMTARRRIHAGEEVTYDYATSESEYLNFECRCGSASCRGMIHDDDHRLPELRARYAGHRLTYLD
jgi:uncharacterized protein